MTDTKFLTRQRYTPEFKFPLVRIKLKVNGSVAALPRQHDVNDNILFEWMRLWKIRAVSLSRAGAKQNHLRCSAGPGSDSASFTSICTAV
ncbi:transposase (plasmid) [Pantoea sp. BJ2]|uniref:Transposase n=1 Tax=Pantoea sp. BJ2 TaxID=3141322 RepID=A0AAU7U3B5_9GAMM